jgi:cobalt-precorrin 5A hydrolase
LSALGIRPVITTATEATGRDSVEALAQRSGCEVVNRDSTRKVNATMLDVDVPVFTVKGPGIVIAGSDVSILVKKGEYTVGVGCRKGVKSHEVIDAIRKALEEAKVVEKDVLVYATTQKKSGEKGLLSAISALSGNLIFLDDEAGQEQPAALNILGIDAGVADLGVGHGDHLPLVGRVGQHLLITGHGRIKDDLSGRLSGRAE